MDVVTVTHDEVLAVGRSGSTAPPKRWRRWVWRVLAVALVVAALVSAAIDLGLWPSGPPATGLRVLATGPDGLTWINADTGERTAVDADPDADSSNATVVGDGVVVRYPSTDPALAARVVAYRAGDEPNDVGEADQVVPTQGSGLWLVVNGDAPTAGGVALTTAFGDWRSRVFTLPPHLDVVGALDDALVVVRGEFRYRRLLLWDVQAQAPIRRYGLTIGVREVLGTHALVTTGCLTSGCTSAVLDLNSGRSTEVEVPTGYVESATPVLTRDGVVAIVVDRTGATALAMGPPHGVRVVDVPGLEPARGDQPIVAPGGWLAVPTGDGDVSLWREGADPEQLPTVQLTEDERMIGVSQ